MVLLMLPLQLMMHGVRVLVLGGLYFQYVSRRHAASFWTRQAAAAARAPTLTLTPTATVTPTPARTATLALTLTPGPDP